MYLPALRASVVIWLAGFLAACAGETDRAATDPINDAPPSQEASNQEVAASQDVEPSLTLTASERLVGSGDSVTLTWTSEGTDSCSASGGWSGDKATNGSEVSAPVTGDTTYTLTCSGSLGNAMAMIEVSANGTLAISWQPPTENVDGSPLMDLDGYTIYYGESPGNYTDQVTLDDPGATDFSVTVAAGEYYVAMTATDLDGNESALSNEVVKQTL